MDPTQLLNQLVQATSNGTPTVGGFSLEPTVTTTEGADSVSRTALLNPADLAIRMGAWELRLLPTPTGTDSSLRVPIELRRDATTLAFRSITIDVGRLELVCDPTVLIPGSLRTEPFQHIVRVTDPNARVRLFGPGLRLRFSGDTLSDVSVDVTGAEGATSATLPSLRFDPPHFLVGGDTVGIACDEAVLDLLDTESLPNVPVAPGTDARLWKGLFLKELGVFVGNGAREGSGDWAGNAVLRNFFVGFDPVELSGTFRAELVHLVADVVPQVVVEIVHGTTTTSNADVALPAPTGETRSHRVRMRAIANWDSMGDTASASMRARWTVPAAVSVEEPARVERMDLGDVLVPPGDHQFTLVVTDPRVTGSPFTVTRRVQVAGPPAAATPRALRVTADAQRALADGNTPRQRVQVGVAQGETVTVRARATDGTGAVDFALAVPTGWPAAAPQAGVARDAVGVAEATWTVVAPASGTGTGVFVVTATAGGQTAHHRVRSALEAPTPPGTPDFRLSSYTDARPDPGVVQALVEPRNGVTYDDLTWKLEVRAAPDDLFASGTHDALFEVGSAGWSDTGLLPTLSAGAVRTFLPDAERLYRLTGTRGAAATSRPPVLLAGRPSRADESAAIRAVGGLADTPDAPSAGADFLFAYDDHTVFPSTIARQGPEHTSLRLTVAQLRDAQIAALAGLFRLLVDEGAVIDTVHIFGAASVEGDDDYNLTLATNRATAVRDKLASAASDAILTAAATQVGRPWADIRAILATKTIEIHSFGEAHSHTVSVNGTTSVDPRDRRVFFAVSRTNAAVGQIVREEFFVTRRDAEVIPSPVPPPLRPLQQHPFEHHIFRKATTEIVLLRNRIVKFQVVLVLDLEAFNENEADPRVLNNADGITTFFLEFKDNPAPAAGEPSTSWELAVLADPRDADGLFSTSSVGVLDVVGGPAITIPAITAVSGGEVGAGAFIAAATVGAILSGTGLVDVQFLAVGGLRARVRYGNGAGTELRFGIDYKLKYMIDVDLESRFGIPVVLQTTQPIEIGFRNVGVEIREGRDVKFFYKPDEGFALDVRDPGVFQLGEGVGRLLRVDRVRLGAGSPTWFEVELGLSVETGIFSIDTLRIRVSFDSDKLFPTTGDVSFDPAGFLDGFDLSINKLAISVDVPGTLAGSGELEITNDAGTLTVAGAADLEIVPLKLQIGASAKFVSRSTPTPLTAFFGSIGAEFTPGFPLGTTGIALQGLEGLLGVNMKRSQPDPMLSLPWYMQPSIGATDTDKWVADEGRWVVGAGAVLGTAYDAGFTFNLKGLFLLELPGPRFTLAANADIIKPPPQLSDGAQQATIAALVMMDFENELFLIALDFRYTIEHLLDLHVPIEAFFNLKNARDWHIRFGQWEPASKRISIRLLNLFDASGYVQIEGDKLQNSRLDLIGPAVGLGARVEVNWGARPVVWFEAFLEWHVGLQLSPFLAMGSIEVGGSLHLGPFSIGGRGLLTVKAPDPLLITGEVCGEIDLWLFSIEGCASISIGSGDAAPPAPNDPFQTFALVDRYTDRTIATESGATGVPIDAVVSLGFTQDMNDARATPGVTLFPGTFRNQISTGLFYEFDVVDVRVFEGGVARSGVQSAWAPLTLPGATPTTIKAQRSLRLFDWMPQSHSRAVNFEAGFSETLLTVVQTLCDPTPPPVKRCASFDEEPLGPRALWVLDESDLHDLYVTDTRQPGLGSEHLQTTYGLLPSRVVPLPDVTWAGQVPKSHVLELGSGWGRVTFPDLWPGAAYPPAVEPRPRFDWREVLTKTRLRAGIAGLRPRRLGVDAVEGLRVETTVSAVEATVLSPFMLEEESVLTASARKGPLAALVDETPDIAPFAASIAKMAESGKATMSTTGARTWLTWYIAGLVWVAVPDLYEVDALFLLPRKAWGGEVLFLDARFKPVGFVHKLPDAPSVSSTAGARGQNVVRVHESVTPDPAQSNGIRWMLILPPTRATASKLRGADLSSYLLQICGKRWDEWKAWHDKEEDRLHSLELLTTVGGVGGAVPPAPEGQLLKRDTLYRVELDVAWRRYGAPSGGATAGNAAFGTVVREFRTATVAPADLAPYVDSRSPASDDQPHYTHEPLSLAFRTKTVDAIWKEYGKQLVVRAKANLGGEVFHQPIDSSGADGFVPAGSPESALTEAFASGAVPCVGTDWNVTPGAMVKTATPFSPNTDYTVTVHARPLAEPGALDVGDWDAKLQADVVNDGAADAAGNRVVYRFPMRTSRYSGFVAHVQAYRAAAPFDALVDAGAVLPTASARSDADVDTLSEALFAGPLRLPTGPEIVRLWQPTGSAAPYTPPTVAFRGVLLDGVEPLLRKAGDGADRVTLEARVGATWATGTVVSTRVVAGARGARVFVLTPTVTGPTTLLLRLVDAGPAGTVTEELVVPVGTAPAAYTE